MISPTSFADVLAGSVDRKENIQKAYAAKILRKLKSIYPITTTLIGYLYDDNDSSPMDSIRHEVDNEEFNALEIRHIKDVRLITFLRNPQDTVPWKIFVDNMSNAYNPGYSGVIFPVLHGGDFIIHNLGSPFERSFDHAKIVMQSRDTNLNDLIIEPLDNFIEERKRSDT